MDTVTLTCDGRTECADPVTHIDDKGFAYCAAHGRWRQQYRRCRKLRPHELRKLLRGEPLARY